MLLLKKRKRMQSYHTTYIVKRHHPRGADVADCQSKHYLEYDIKQYVKYCAKFNCDMCDLHLK